MAHIRLAAPHDVDGLSGHERIRADDLAAIVGQGRVLVAHDDRGQRLVGWLRWGMFWDEIPFMNHLYVDEQHRHRGTGALLVHEWETHCRAQGFSMVMTSTVAAESAQHFYRKLGYVDSGCLILPNEPIEILMRKQIG